MIADKSLLDWHSLSKYVARADNRNREPVLGVLQEKLLEDPPNNRNG